MLPHVRVARFFTDECDCSISSWYWIRDLFTIDRVKLFDRGLISFGDWSIGFIIVSMYSLRGSNVESTWLDWFLLHSSGCFLDAVVERKSLNEFSELFETMLVRKYGNAGEIFEDFFDPIQYFEDIFGHFVVKFLETLGVVITFGDGILCVEDTESLSACMAFRKD